MVFQDTPATLYVAGVFSVRDGTNTLHKGNGRFLY